MSFFFDLPALFILGTALYYVGKKFEMETACKDHCRFAHYPLLSCRRDATLCGCIPRSTGTPQ